MKKFLALILALMLVGCSAPTQSDNSDIPADDAPKSYGFTKGDAAVTEVVPSDYDCELSSLNSRINSMLMCQYVTLGDTIYLEYAGSLYVSDSHGARCLMCNNPDCDHRGAHCSGCVSINGNLMAYNNALWWVGYDGTLHKCSPDGSVTELFSVQDKFLYTTFIHREYLYTLDTNGEWVKFKRYGLVSGSCEVILNLGEYRSTAVLPHKENIYIVTTGNHNEIFRFSDKTGELVTLYSGERFDDYSFGIHDGKLYASGSNSLLSVFDESTASFSEIIPYSSDYDSVVFDDSVVIAYSEVAFTKSLEIGYRVYSYDGQLVGEGLYKTFDGYEIQQTEKWMARCVGATNNEVLFAVMFSSSNTYTQGPKNQQYFYLLSLPKYDGEPKTVFAHHYLNEEHQ